MKKSEIKAGVLYAYQTSKYRKPQPVVVLDVTKTYVSGAAKHGKVDPLSPRWVERLDHRGKPMFSKGDAFSRDVGFLAVGRGAARPGCEVPRPDSNYLAGLRKVTLADALGVRFGDTIAGTVLSEIGLVNPRFVLGEWDVVMGHLDAEAEIIANLSALNKAESDARVAAATARVKALRALGLPGTIDTPSEDRVWRSGVEKAAATYSGNTKTITLTLAQVDALLSLIPEGATIPEAVDTEDDGWTLRKPQYDQDDQDGQA